MLFNSYSYEILYEQFRWIYLQGDIKLLLVTINNRLKLEIEIVHDLSCHPILLMYVAAAAANVSLSWSSSSSSLLCVWLTSAVCAVQYVVVRRSLKHVSSPRLQSMLLLLLLLLSRYHHHHHHHHRAVVVARLLLPQRHQHQRGALYLSRQVSWQRRRCLKWPACPSAHSTVTTATSSVTVKRSLMPTVPRPSTN